MKNRYIFLSVFVLIFISCRSGPVFPAGIVEERIESENRKTAAALQHYTVNFIAAGDNLFHESVINSSLAGKEYDFSPIYTEIKSIVENADLAFINQETVMAGASYGYSGYPAFNTPQSLAVTLAETGFDIFNLANNHAMDMGASGLIATLDFLDTIEGITVIGARKEGDSARIVTVNNITFGFLAYAHSLNGIALPKNNPNLVSMNDKNKMQKEIEALRPLCDFLVVSMHWGDEYKLEPGKDQIDLAKFLAERNVDLIVGHHPHVLQRVETLPRPDGKETICYYSLGNFCSHQREKERLIGGMISLTFSKQEKKPENDEEKEYELSITGFGMIPVVTHYDRSYKNTKVYPLYSYTAELLETHGYKRSDPAFTMDFLYTVPERLQTEIILKNPFLKETTEEPEKQEAQYEQEGQATQN